MKLNVSRQEHAWGSDGLKTDVVTYVVTYDWKWARSQRMTPAVAPEDHTLLRNKIPRFRPWRLCAAGRSYRMTGESSRAIRRPEQARQAVKPLKSTTMTRTSSEWRSEWVCGMVGCCMLQIWLCENLMSCVGKGQQLVCSRQYQGCHPSVRPKKEPTYCVKKVR